MAVKSFGYPFYFQLYLYFWKEVVCILNKFLFGIYIAFICMAIVFLILFLLNIAIKIQRSVITKLLNRRQTKEKNMTHEAVLTLVPAEDKMEDDEELIAVIAAAAAVVMDKPVSKLVVRSIRRIDNNTAEWSKAAIYDQINTRF